MEQIYQQLAELAGNTAPSGWCCLGHGPEGTIKSAVTLISLYMECRSRSGQPSGWMPKIFRRC